MLNRLAPRNMLQSRQASNNSNQQSSMDDSGVVDDHDDHDGDDVTSAEEHERREHPAAPMREHRLHERHQLDSKRNRQPLEQLARVDDLPTPLPVTVSVRTSNREIRVLKYNGIKSKKHLYELPPEYLSHIVVLGELFFGVLTWFFYFLFEIVKEPERSTKYELAEQMLLFAHFQTICKTAIARSVSTAVLTTRAGCAFRIVCTK